jgi:hypothetical protein
VEITVTRYFTPKRNQPTGHRNMVSLSYDLKGTRNTVSPELPPLISPVKKASRVEMRVSHQAGAQKALDL